MGERLTGAVAAVMVIFGVLVAAERTAVACNVNADCPASAPTCVRKVGSSSGVCHASCNRESDCSRFSSQPHCETVNGTGRLGQCVACRSNNGSADCTTNTTPQCGALNTCTACSGSTGETACNTHHGGRHCEDNNTPASLQGTCVVCRGERPFALTDCPGFQPLCNAPTDTCGACDTGGTSECVKFGASFVCDNPASGGTGACVGCITDNDCVDSTSPHCVSKICEGCDSTTVTHGDESCARFADAGTPACQPADGISASPGQCGICSKTNGSSCTGATPACYEVAGTCQLCTVAIADGGANAIACADAGSGHACEGTGTSVFCGCSTNGDCDMTTVGSICDGTTHECRACDVGANECPPNMACASTGPRVGHCVACVDDSTCTKPTVCDSSQNACVGCLTNADCKNPTPKCDRETCAPCTADSDCATNASGHVCAKSGSTAGQCVTPEDAGASASDAGTFRDSGSDAADGNDGASAGDSGCGCAVDERSDDAAWGGLVFFCLVLGATRRRKRPRA